MLGVGEFILGHWRAAACLVIVLALASYIETLRLERDHAYNERDRISNKYEKFKTDTAALGKQAEADKLAKEAADKNRKDAADAENSAALATLAGDIGRLRRERPSRGLVPSASALAGGADVACFSRPELERAYGTLIFELRGLGDEGSKAVVDLDTVKKWAQNAPNPPQE